MGERNAVRLVAPAVVRPVTPPLPVRHPAPDDLAALAELMLDAFWDTIDYDGEGWDEAQAEVASYFEAAKSPLLDCSFVALADGRPVAACLLCLVEGEPLAVYVYTGAAWKGRGLATALLQQSINAVAAHGYPSVALWVTVGNEPAERVYAKLGFQASTG
jgi:GNAT superfamily N-acetyltransferase